MRNTWRGSSRSSANRPALQTRRVLSRHSKEGRSRGLPLVPTGASEPSGLDRLQLLRYRRARWCFGVGEGELVAVAGDAHDAAFGELAEQQLLGQRLLDVLLDYAPQGPGAEELVVAFLRQPLAGRIVELDGDVAVGELLLELQDEL